MSARAREEGQNLRRRYASTFRVELDDVEMKELPDDDVEVWCPKRPDLPKWTTGPLY